MKGVAKFYKEPHPRSCHFVAAWPGIGNVALIVAQYLIDKLEAEEIGEILPFDFFDPIGVIVRDNVIETPQFPENKFYYWHNPKSETDLVMFIGEEQPGFKGYELAQRVLEIAQKFKKTFMVFGSILLISIIGDYGQSVHSVDTHTTLDATSHFVALQAGHFLFAQKIV